MRRHNKRVERIEQAIVETETKISQITASLQDPDLSSNWEKLISLQKEKTELEKQLEKLFREYEKLTG